MKSESAKPNKFHRMLFNAFKSQMVQLSYESPKRNKKVFKQDVFDFCFNDSLGRAYYKYKDDKKIDVVRKLHIAHKYIQLVSGISETDITESVKGIEIAIHEVDKKDRMKPNIARIGFICSKLLNRRTRLVNEETLFELAAIYFIREDEVIGMYDESLQSNKIKHIKADYLHGVRELFFEKSINELFPFIEDKELFNAALEDGRIEVMAYLEHLKQYTDGRRDKG